MIDFDIIVNTEEGNRQLRQCLDSILAQTSVNYNCIVVTSKDDEMTANIVESEHPAVGLIRKNTSDGQDSSWNSVLGACKGKYIAFLDANVFLKDDSWLARAKSVFDEYPKIAQLAPRIHSADDENILLSCGISGSFPFFHRFHGTHANEADSDALNTRALVLGASGAATVIRRSTLKEQVVPARPKCHAMAGLDTSIQLHLAGHDVVYIPELTAYKWESVSSSGCKDNKHGTAIRDSLPSLLKFYPDDYVKQCLGDIMDRVSSSFTSNYQILLQTPNSSELDALADVLTNAEEIRIARNRAKRKARINPYYLLKLDIDLHDAPPYGYLPVRNLIFSVTDHCNAKCPMCFRTDDLNNNANTLSVSEIQKIMNQLPSLQTVVITGGEPMLRRDILEVCRVFLKLKSQPALTLTTNGSCPEQLLRLAETLFEENVPRLSISLSLDGDKTYHDKNRGITGLFEKVETCYELLLPLKDKYPQRLNLQVNTCVTKENLPFFDTLAQYMRDKMPLANWGFEPVRGHYNENIVGGLSNEDWQRLEEKAQELSKKGKPHYTRLLDIFNAAEIVRKEGRFPFPIPCRGGDEFIVLNANGDLAPCEALGPRLNVRDIDYDMRRVLRNPGWLKKMDYIKSGECSCTHFCWLANTMSRYKLLTRRPSPAARMLAESKTPLSLLIKHHIQDRLKSIFKEHGDSKEIALFGAGEHTPWLLQLLGEIGKRENVVIIYDDKPRVDSLQGIPVQRPEYSAATDIIIVSSDVYEIELAESASRHFGETAKVFLLYEEIGMGPHPKATV